MKFSELSETYHPMRRPSFSLTVGGETLDTGPGARLIRAQCDLTTGPAAGMLEVVGRVDPEGETGKQWLRALQVGAKGSFSLGWNGTDAQVFSGLLYEVSWSDPLAGGGMEVEAVFLDAKGTLALTSVTELAGERKLSALIGAALDASGASVTQGTVPADWDLPVCRWGPTCRDVLDEAARLLCWEFYDFCGKLYFGPPRPERESILEYDGPAGLYVLRRFKTLAGQWGAVAVAGGDDGGERLWSKTERPADSGFGTAGISAALGGVLYTPEGAVRTMAQAQYLSQARMEDVRRNRGGVTGRGVGLPLLRPGRFVTFSALSEALNGTYYLRCVRHILNDEGFETGFEAEE